jgi:hypothetical protein
MERVHQVYLSIPGDRFTDLSIGRNISFAATDSPLRESCRDLIRTTDTTRVPRAPSALFRLPGDAAVSR